MTASLSFGESRKRCSASIQPPPSSDRWDHTIQKLDAKFDRHLEELRRPRQQRQHDAASYNYNSSSNSMTLPLLFQSNDEYYSALLHAPGTRADTHHHHRHGGNRLQLLLSQRMNSKNEFYSPHIVSVKTFHEWTNNNNNKNTTNVSMKMESNKLYYERCISTLHSLLMKMITVRVVDNNNNNNNNGKKTTVMELAVDPKYIVAENILVQYTNEEGDTLHFIRTADDDDNNDNANNTEGATTNEDSACNNDDEEKKYAAMKALGIIAYETVMRRGSSGHYPPIQSFLPSTIHTSGGYFSSVVNIGRLRYKIIVRQ
eukprot:scaffold14139_cov74-Cyclotella_meneghiniana.AAC.21